MKKGIRIALVFLGIAALLGIIGFVIWGFYTPWPSNHQALDAMESNANVTVQDKGTFIVFTPTPNTPVPVHFLSRGTCGLSILCTHRAGDRQPGIHGFPCQDAAFSGRLRSRPCRRSDHGLSGYRVAVIGGHSLGGSMAASYAWKHTDNVQGLAFWASYPATSDDLSSTSLKGLSGYWSNDLVLGQG